VEAGSDHLRSSGDRNLARTDAGAGSNSDRYRRRAWAIDGDRSYSDTAAKIGRGGAGGKVCEQAVDRNRQVRLTLDARTRLEGDLRLAGEYGEAANIGGHLGARSHGHRARAWRGVIGDGNGGRRGSGAGDIQVVHRNAGIVSEAEH